MSCHWIVFDVGCVGRSCRGVGVVGGSCMMDRVGGFCHCVVDLVGGVDRWVMGCWDLLGLVRCDRRSVWRLWSCHGVWSGLGFVSADWLNRGLSWVEWSS